MKILYFTDTDTALIEFSNVAVEETREVSEDVYLDLDAQGALVRMTRFSRWSGWSPRNRAAVSSSRRWS